MASCLVCCRLSIGMIARHLYDGELSCRLHVQSSSDNFGALHLETKHWYTEVSR